MLVLDLFKEKYYRFSTKIPLYLFLPSLQIQTVLKCVCIIPMHASVHFLFEYTHLHELNNYLPLWGTDHASEN